jgi:hypothetical protein
MSLGYSAIIGLSPFEKSNVAIVLLSGVTNQNTPSSPLLYLSSASSQL